MQDLRPMLKEMVERGRTLRAEEAHAAVGAMLDGNVTDVEIAALLTVLAQRGETVDEVTGVVMALRERLMPLPVTDAERAELVDTCGTGGDGSRHIQHFDRGCAGGGGCGREGGEAWQSRADFALRIGGCAGGAGRAGGSHAGAGGGLPAGARLCLPVRADLASDDAAGAAGAAGAGLPQYLSPGRAAEQSGRRAGAVDGRVCAGEGRAGGRDDGAAGRAARHGGAWRGWAGRADADRSDDGGGGAGGTTRMYEVVPEQLGLERVRGEALLGAESAAGNAEILEAILSR